MGKAKIVKEGWKENEQIVGLKKPVDFLGFKDLMSNDHYTTTAIALEESSVCVIEKHDFFDVVANNSQLAFDIISLFARQLTEAHSRMNGLTQKYMRARLADALLLVQDVYGSRPDNSLKISLKRSDLAALTSMTTANVIRMLSAFAKENVINVNRRIIKIIDMEALKRISVSDK